MNEQNNKFEYTYSAPTEEERREILGIRKSYQSLEQKDSKLERLRKLDRRVRNTASCIALSIGIAGILIFGLGLTSILEWNRFILGSSVAVVGAAAMILAYPVHQKVLKASKKKHAPEILLLSEEVLNEYDKKS